MIVLTGDGSLESEAEALALGACGCILKPCTLSELGHRCQIAYAAGRLAREKRDSPALVQASEPGG